MKRELIVGFIAVIAVIVTASATSADKVQFTGIIYEHDGSRADTAPLEITRDSSEWIATTFGGLVAGVYKTSKADIPDRNGTYKIRVGMSVIEKEFKGSGKSGFEEQNGVWVAKWIVHLPEDYEIPEFSTIAIPIASILGLLFFFRYRKRKSQT